MIVHGRSCIGYTAHCRVVSFANLILTNMTFRHLLTAAIASTAVTACATATPVTTGSPPRNEQTTQTMPGTSRWTGKLNPTQSYTGSAVATERQMAYGNVELTVSPNSPNLTHVRLTVSVRVEPGMDNLGWAIHPGTCGSGNPPVLTPGAFPMMVLSANGRAAVDNDIPYVLPESGNFHLNVFRGSGTQLSDVITCADLRKQS